MISCPHCKKEVPAQQINVATDFALCANCNQGFRPSVRTNIPENFEKQMQQPPDGCFYRKEAGAHIIGATTRSPLGFFLVPFTLVWTGGSLGSIYGRQIADGEFQLLQSVVGLPFLIGSFMLAGVTSMALAGRVEVTIKGMELTVFTGVGRWGWTRRFPWSSVRTIQELQKPGRQPSTSISVEGDERLVFGSGLNDARRYFMINALSHLAGKLHG